jgi:hypothetical protein
MAILGSFVTFLAFTSLVASQFWCRQRDFFRHEGHFLQGRFPAPRPSSCAFPSPAFAGQIHNIAAHRPRASQRSTYYICRVRRFRREFEGKT